MDKKSNKETWYLLVKKRFQKLKGGNRVETSLIKHIYC